MTENIKASIKHEVSLSMKEGNKFRITTLRLMVSAFQVEEINKKAVSYTHLTLPTSDLV